MVLRQEEGGFGGLLGGKFADGHGDLVACVAAGAVHAVLPHLVRQCAVFGGVEVEVLEEGWDSGEETDALDAAGCCLIENGLNEEATGSVAFDVWIDYDGADLGEVLAVDVHGGTADELAGVGFADGEGADVGADLSIGAMEEGAIMRETLDQLIDGSSVLQARWTRMHGYLCRAALLGEGWGVRGGCR